MIRIAFFDIDGTLMELDGHGISQTMKDTLVALKKSGIKIVIATGRLATMIPDLGGVEFDAYITFNGSYCYTDNALIHRATFHKEDVHTLFENAEKYQLAIVAVGEKNHYRCGFDRDLTPYYTPMGTLEERLPEEEIYQFMVSCRKTHYKRILDNTKHARVTDWQGKTADIYPENSGKNIGVQKVLNHFGCSTEEAIVFGDGNNDIAMFQAVGTSVAMGNASEHLKELATHICPRVEEEGITVFCKEFGLI